MSRFLISWLSREMSKIGKIRIIRTRGLLRCSALSAVLIVLSLPPTRTMSGRISPIPVLIRPALIETARLASTPHY